MDPAKISTIINWPTLVNVKDVQSFLEFVNFYRRFIYDYSKIAALLTHLTKKDVAFAWSLKCQMAFNTLKEAFISNVILHHYNPDHKIVVETNASDYVSEDILSQYNEDEVLHPVAYFLKKHNSAECNYKIYDKKLMIIICAFEEWCLKLEGFTSPVEVITDHKNLKYFMFIKQLSCHQACWSEFLSCFNYHITYHSDKAKGKSNALTCWSGNLSREGDISDPHHLYQHQMVLKSHVLDLRILKTQCQSITLDPIQLHLFPIQFSFFVTLAFMDLDPEESNPDDAEPQLDQETSDFHEDPADTPTQTLWDQAESNDKFTLQILKTLQWSLPS